MDIVALSFNVLKRLSKLGYEKKAILSRERLVFPNKVQAKGDIKRISEHELRQLFIEEFKKAHPNLFYSIETPTKAKYTFGKSYEEIRADEEGQSALLDMCVLENEGTNYNRILNIEFKYKNAALKNIAKDILKLMHEEQNGAFILLLKNTDSGTLCNNRGTGVFDKFYESFKDFKTSWNGETKSIQFIIMSLKQKSLIHRIISKEDNLEDIFLFKDKVQNIKEVKGNGWTKCTLNKNQHFDCN